MAKHNAPRERAFDPNTFVARPPRQAGPRRSQDLHICPSCDSELVYPIEWEPAGRNRWSVTLRCPDCDWHDQGVHGQAVVDRFDEALDAGTEQLLDDLTLLTRANMEEQAERFVAAIWANQILPEDF